MQISLVVTTFNEEAVIVDLLEGMLLQSIAPGEVVIVDGGSTDNTVSLCQSFTEKYAERNVLLKIYELPGANIAKGRNFGIGQARHSVIAVTDAGCKLDKRWLEIITGPILAGEADFIGGGFRPITCTKFQSVLADLTVYKTQPKNFLPSSRSIAFTKDIWKRAGGYPEWLNWGEDTFFNLQCLKQGARYKAVPGALVFWEVRKNWKEVIRQYYRYALGDGQALRFTRSMLVVQIIYWSNIFMFLTGNTGIALSLLCLFYIAILFKKNKLFTRDFILSFLLTATIQTSRFCGYIVGVVKKIAGSQS